jgi:hypothetical protein
MKATGSKSAHITFTTRRATCPPVHINNVQFPQPEHLDRRLTWHTHLHQMETTTYYPHQNVLVALTQIKTLYKQQTPNLQNYTETNLDLRYTTLGNRIHAQHRNTLMLPVEGSANDKGCTIVYI